MTARPLIPELAYLHGMRAVCALFVAFAHALMMYQYIIQDQNLVFWQYFLFLSQYARYAVSVFIVLSGYCLMHSFLKHNSRVTALFWRLYLVKRIRRIVPAYYAALILALLLIYFVPALDDSSIGLWSGSFPAWTVGSVMTHLVLLHNYFPQWQYSINHPMWSVATEFQIYFLFPILIVVWKKYGAGKLLITSLTITVLLLIILLLSKSSHDPWPPQFLALFGFGMLAGSQTHNETNSKLISSDRKRKMYRNYSLISFVLALVAVPMAKELKQIVPDFLFGASAALMMMYLTDCKLQFKKSIILNIFETSILVNTGNFSYSIYLIHAPILALSYVVGMNIGLRESSLIVFSMTVGMVFVIYGSYVFYRLFEIGYLNRTTQI